MRKILLSTLMICGFSSPALAQDGWFGALLGLSIPNAENTTSRSIYGVTGGAKIGSELGLGAYFLTSAKDESAGTTTFKHDYDLYGIELAYHYEGEANGVYAGARVGTSKVRRTHPTAGVGTTSPMHYGAVVGYNKMLGTFSIGGEANFMQVGSANTSVNGTTIDTPAFNMLNFMATVKLWF